MGDRQVLCHTLFKEISHLLGGLSPKRQETSAGKDEKKRKYCARLIGMENGTATMENRVDVPPP